MFDSIKIAKLTKRVAELEAAIKEVNGWLLAQEGVDLFYYLEATDSAGEKAIATLKTVITLKEQ